MSAAIDLGTSQFRGIRHAEQRAFGRCVPTSYLALPNDEATAALLKRCHVVSHPADDSLLVLGQEAATVAGLIKQPLVPLFSEGKLLPNDPVSRQVFSALIESLLPPAEKQGERCTLTIPNNLMQPGEPERELATRVIKLMGYQPTIIEQTEAVILAEASPTQFNGLGISLGAGSFSLCLAHTGRILASITSPRGGAWIDEQCAKELEIFTFDAAGNRYLDLLQADQIKKTNCQLLRRPESAREKLILHLLQQCLDQALLMFRAALLQTPFLRGSRKRFSAYVCGGCAQPSGFDAFLIQRIEQIGLPVEIDSVRIDKNSWSVARGCMIHCHLEETAPPHRREAA